MKKLIYILLAFILAGCDHFLKEYSQDLVVAKKVEDYDELLLGSVYLPSYTFDQRRMPGGATACSFLNILDDDINTVKKAYLRDLNLWRNTMSNCYGYTTWQMEVGRTLDKENLRPDDATWNDLYTRINITNVILAEIGDIPVSTEQEERDRIRVEGECHFLRAQFYFILVNMYGNAYVPETAGNTPGVPLKLTGYVEHVQGKPTQFSRTSLREVYAQIADDLKEAIKLLTESPQTRHYYRASAGAAELLLGRVYLYMQDWENARTVTRNFLETAPALSSMLAMDENSQPFLGEENNEIVFSQGSLTLQSVMTGYAGDFCVSGDLYGLYDTDKDVRVKVFFSMNDSICLHSKYQMGVQQSRVSDILMLRSAEGYLNMAEACAMLDDQEALHWLNELRSKRILDYQPQTFTGEELVGQIRDERRKELCFEGHRWFDLRRYAVNKRYPFSKKIIRSFCIYDENTQGFPFEREEGYVLEENDPAYTFAIPKSVLEFDLVSMPDNPRKKREPSWVNVKL